MPQSVITCARCGTVKTNSSSACTSCGSLDQSVTTDLIGVETRGEIGNIGWQRTVEYCERHPVLLLITLAVTLGSPFLGLILIGWPGVVVGAASGVATFVLGFFTATKVRVIEKG